MYPISTIRGFKNFTVGPKDPVTGTNEGGNKAFYIQSEILFPLYDPLRLRGLVFFDTGNAFGENQSFSWDVKYGAGVGIHFNSPMGNIQLAWGFNLNPQPGERKQVLYFSAGFDARMLVGQWGAEQRASADSAVEGRLWEVDGQTRYGDSRLRGALAREAPRVAQWAYRQRGWRQHGIGQVQQQLHFWPIRPVRNVDCNLPASRQPAQRGLPAAEVRPPRCLPPRRSWCS